MIDPADVRALAKADCEAITNHLLGQSPNRALSSRRQGKLRYYPHGGFELFTATGKWRSYSDGAHGDMADLVIRQGEAGDQSAALKWLMCWLGIEGEARAGRRGEAAAARGGGGATDGRGKGPAAAEAACRVGFVGGGQAVAGVAGRILSAKAAGWAGGAACCGALGAAEISS